MTTAPNPGNPAARPMPAAAHPAPIIAPYGAWCSPITADAIVAESVGIGSVAFDRAIGNGDAANDIAILWTESRPAEGGRIVIVRRAADGTTADVNPPPYNVRTRVHEYGGGAWIVHNGVVWFSNFDDQRIYRQEIGRQEIGGELPQPITPDAPLRYADAVLDAARSRLICVREDHTDPDNIVNAIVAVPADSASASNSDGGGIGAQTVLAGGWDFVASPRLSPDGAALAWLSWNHPNMPWDGTHLWTAPILDDGTLGDATLAAGGESVSICQPEWSPDGVLHYVSDASGWWNLYRCAAPGLPDGKAAEPLYPDDAEYGRPQWVFAARSYAFAGDGGIICAVNRKGFWSLNRLRPDTRALAPLPVPASEMGRGDLAVSGSTAAVIAGAAERPMSLLRVNLDTAEWDTLRVSSGVDIPSGYISPAQPIEFPSTDSRRAYALYYPPRNPEHQAPDGALPPLLVMSHGGPTGAASGALDPAVQFWTSRGFAVADVNYGGSAGYGRAYRQLLNGNWGIVDVDDCANAALHLVHQGLADGRRLAIRGGSAGGYTTLAALTFRNIFAAGASFYGVSDLAALAADTHKFESRYLDRLVAPYPQGADTYRQRSPIHHTDGLSCPIILLQGLEDKIVPPNQAEMMFDAVRSKGIPCAYLPFAGEQHGFRRSENIKRALEAELYFYGQIFGFTPADTIAPIEIANL